MARCSPRQHIAQPCPQKVSILEVIERHLSEFERTSSVLATRASHLSPEEYDQMLRIIEENRMRADAWKATLSTHLAEHGC